MQYIGLSQSGNYAVGGSTYQTAGRSLDVTPTGPFAQYLSSGTVGASGKSIWLSLLLRKDVNTDDEASATLLASQVAWWGQVGKISVGCFGQSSNSGGSRYWSLKIAGTVYPTLARLTVGQAALLVVRD